MVQYKLSQLVSSASEAQTAQLSGEVVCYKYTRSTSGSMYYVRNYSDHLCISVLTEIFCKGCYDRSCKGLIGIQKDFITNRYVNYRNDIKGI